MLVEQKKYHEILSLPNETNPFDIDCRELKKGNNPDVKMFINELPTPISTPLTPTPFTPLFIPRKH